MKILPCPLKYANAWRPVRKTSISMQKPAYFSVVAIFAMSAKIHASQALEV
jgi:hypothetical protein